MIWFIRTSITITINYNSSVNDCVRLAPFPYWTTSVLFSTVTNDERRITAHWIIGLPYESINPLKTKCVLYNIYKNSVRTSQKTRYVTTTNPNLLILFREQSRFIVRTIRNTQIHYVRRMGCCIVLKHVENIITTRSEGLIDQFMNELSFITWGESTGDHRLEQFVFWRVLLCYYSLPRKCVLARRWPETDYFGYSLQRKRVLASRCLAMDYSSFQVSCQNMYALICIRDIVVGSFNSFNNFVKPWFHNYMHYFMLCV
jgi:hypothetical protein